MHPIVSGSVDVEGQAAVGIAMEMRGRAWCVDSLATWCQHVKGNLSSACCQIP